MVLTATPHLGTDLDPECFYSIKARPYRRVREGFRSLPSSTGAGHVSPVCSRSGGRLPNHDPTGSVRSSQMVHAILVGLICRLPPGATEWAVGRVSVSQPQKEDR